MEKIQKKTKHRKYLIKNDTQAPKGEDSEEYKQEEKEDDEEEMEYIHDGDGDGDGDGYGYGEEGEEHFEEEIQE